MRVDIREKLLKCVDLLLHGMTAIIDQDIDPGDLLRQLLQKRSVFLIANEYLHLFIFKLLAMWIDVYPEDACMRSKIMLPHLHRAPVRDAKFHNVDIAASKTGKVSIVNLKIMIPFVN